LKNKIDVNVTNESGRNLAHIAADYNFVDILKYLHSKGAKLDNKDKHGITPILAAILEGNAESVEYLLSAGANKKGTAPDGRTYLQAAGDNAALKKLLS